MTDQKIGVQWDSTSAVHGLKDVSDSVKREVLYSIITEIEVPMKLGQMIKMCFSEKYNTVQVNICMFLSK
jgi:hypothetical protein